MVDLPGTSFGVWKPEDHPLGRLDSATSVDGKGILLGPWAVKLPPTQVYLLCPYGTLPRIVCHSNALRHRLPRSRHAGLDGFLS